MTPARWIGLDLVGLEQAQGAERAAGERALTEAAEGYLWAGGVVTPELWTACAPSERAALIAAGRRVAVLRSAWAGRASQGELPAAEVLSLIDGGETHDDVLLVRSMGQLREQIEAARGR